MRTPVTTLQALLKYIEDYEQEKANVASATTAQLTHYLLQIDHNHKNQGNPGAKSLNSKPEMFLPYAAREINRNTVQLSQETKDILVHLLKTRQIPMHVYSQLISPPTLAR